MSVEDTQRKRAAAQHLADAAAVRTAPGAKRQRPMAGTFPQVSLLPREMLQGGRRRRIRRRLVAAVVVVAVVVAAGIAGSAAMAVGAAGDLAARTRQQTLLQQQLLRYQAVQRIDSHLALDRSAARVGSSTAIDWDARIDLITAGLPAGFAITAVMTDAATPVTDYAQGVTPLDRPRAAMVAVTARATSLAQLPAWISSVTSLPDVADASPVVSSVDGGKYTVVLTVHLTTKAYITPLTSGSAK
ncbi:MAG TPA: hypothetical protein VGO26_08700 [Amnibacterium sp.]|nr:hypothetical protein [Amnibacterium sp.]